MKYNSDDERRMVKDAINSGWQITSRNANGHIVMQHSSGARYPLPKEAKNKHVLHRVARQMKQMINNPPQYAKQT